MMSDRHCRLGIADADADSDRKLLLRAQHDVPWAVLSPPKVQNFSKYIFNIVLTFRRFSAGFAASDADADDLRRHRRRVT